MLQDLAVEPWPGRRFGDGQFCPVSGAYGRFPGAERADERRRVASSDSLNVR